MLAAIGDLVLDISIVPDAELRLGDDTPACIRLGGGGQAANFCAWVAALDGQARLLTRVGDDDTGRHLVAELRDAGVDVCAAVGPEPTGIIAVLIGPEGEGARAAQRGAIVGLRPEDLDDRWLADIELLHVPAYSLFDEPLAGAATHAVRRVRRHGALVAVDLSSAASLETYGPQRFAELVGSLSPDLLFANQDEAQRLAVPLEDLARVPVVKLGAHGCRIFDDVIPAPSVRQVDATGAGDAFAAAFCLDYLRCRDATSAATHAVEVAARAVTHVGARP